jgi:Fe-S cluster assembly protein SufD
MNMHAQMHTAAEKALFAAYDTLVSDLPGDGEVDQARQRAGTAQGRLPTKRIEAWHYTDLRRLLTKVPELTERGEAKPAEPVLDNSLTLSLLNGVSRVAGNLPDGVTVTRLAEKLTDGSFAPALEPRGLDDAIGALNTALSATAISSTSRTARSLKADRAANIQAGGLDACTPARACRRERESHNRAA